MAECSDQESTLLVTRLVHVYRVPPRQGSASYSCSSWLVNDKIFSGRLVVVERGSMCVVKLVSCAATPGRDQSQPDELFAECPILLGQRSVAVEPVSDSSRYFVIRLQQRGDAGDRQAFVGLGFDEREEAFDFMAALLDHEKQQRSRVESEERQKVAGPSTDYSLQSPITLNVGFAKKSSPPAPPRAPSASVPLRISPPPAPSLASSTSGARDNSCTNDPLPSDWESF